MSANSKKERGQILVMTTVMLVPLFGLIGLVADIGYMRFIKTSAQTAAEAAAEAAIIDVHATVGGSINDCTRVVCAQTPTACPATITTPANSLERGCLYAQRHGFTSSGNQTVTYQAYYNSVPPTAPGMESASYWITFRVTQRVPQLFSAILGNTTGVVAARSTTAIIGASDCIYALDPNASDTGLSISGSVTVNSRCGIYVNSSNPSSALSTNGSASLSAPEYDVVGGVSTHTPLSPTPNTGVSPVSDPLSNLPAPASAPYTCNASYSGGDATLSEGVYCGGIHIGNATVKFNPGTYILVGGGLSTQSTNSIISPSTGVMFYNTYGNAYNNGVLKNYSYGPISLNANSQVSLTARTDGTYAGILFFEDRTAGALTPGSNSDSFCGGASAFFQGVIYAPNSSITMCGNSAITQYTLVVAYQISLSGDATFNSDYSLLPSGSPIQQVAHVE